MSGVFTSLFFFSFYISGIVPSLFPSYFKLLSAVYFRQLGFFFKRKKSKRVVVRSRNEFRGSPIYLTAANTQYSTVMRV